MNKLLGTYLILGGLLVSSGYAATGFSFLELGTSVRTAGLGGASVALTQESGTLLVNPSGIASPSNMDLNAMHSTWIEGMVLEAVTFSIPSSVGTFGVGAFWLSTPNLERRGINRELLGTFGATSWSGAVSYSTLLDSTFSLGVNLKMVGEQLDDISASGVAVDLGGQWSGLVDGLTVGLALQHLGPAVKYVNKSTALPTTINFGFAYHLPLGVLLAADWTYRPGDQLSVVHVGTEVTPVGPLAFRMGYSAFQGVSGSPVMVGTIPLPMGLVGGISVSLGQQSLDYAVVPVNGFGLTHRMGIRARW